MPWGFPDSTAKPSRVSANKGIRVYQDGKQKIVRDFSGKPESVNKALLDLLLEHGYVPVLTVPIVDEENNAINTENDDVVRVLQQSIRAGTVINLIEAPGFLADKDDESTLISKDVSPGTEAREQQVAAG